MSSAPQLQRGYIILLALVFAGIFATVTVGLVGYVLSYERAGRAATATAQALAIAEGALDAAAEQLNADPNYAGQSDTALGGGTFTIAVAAVDSKTKRVTATGYVPDRANAVATKTVQANIGITDSVISFHYGIQAGAGGFTLNNSSSIRGNVFAAGPVIGSSENDIYGDVISSGPSGLVYGIHATSSVYAHTIGASGEDTIVDKDAYYATTKVNTTVHGASHPNSPDQANAPLPISDAQIGEWEDQAVAGGTAACPGGVYTVSSGTASIGPKKIPCDLNITGSSIVTISGHVWVTGNVNVQNSAQVKMAAALGSQNVAIIADNPANRITSSKIRISNTASFQNSGTPGSFIFLISQNNSAENGGNEEAFSLSNSASALVAYAPHGLVPISNNVSLKEVTAYKISLANSANVTYDTGLQSAVFESGPGGSWEFIPGTYAITR